MSHRKTIHDQHLLRRLRKSSSGMKKMIHFNKKGLQMLIHDLTEVLDDSFVDVYFTFSLTDDVCERCEISVSGSRS